MSEPSSKLKPSRCEKERADEKDLEIKGKED